MYGNFRKRNPKKPKNEEESDEESEDTTTKIKKKKKDKKIGKQNESEEDENSIFTKKKLVKFESVTPYDICLPAMPYADLPKNLNNLIIVGTYLMHNHMDFFFSEMDLSDKSLNLANHPNFQIFFSEINNLVKKAAFYSTKEIIRILSIKFMKYIYFCYPFDGGLNEYSPLCISKDSITPEYQYLILPCEKNNIEKCFDSFEYCIQGPKIEKVKSSNGDNDLFIKKFKINYQLKWLIMVENGSYNDSSCPRLNSSLYFKIDSKSYLKYSNCAFSTATANEFMELDSKNWKPFYFCYERENVIVV